MNRERVWMSLLVLAFVVVAGGTYLVVRFLALAEFHEIVANGNVEDVGRFTESWWLPIDGRLDGRTALSVAAYAERMDMMDLLLEAGARPEVFVSDDLTGIQLAAAEAPSDMFFRLLETGATFDVNGEYPRGESILARRISLSSTRDESDDAKVARYLIEEGADLNYVTVDGNSLVHLAVGDDDTQVLRMLCEAGADLDTVHTLLGNSPLHGAVMRGVEWVKILVEHGADLNVVETSRHRTPLQMAKERLAEKFDPELQKVVEYLESLEADE